MLKFNKTTFFSNFKALFLPYLLVIVIFWLVDDRVLHFLPTFMYLRNKPVQMQNPNQEACLVDLFEVETEFYGSRLKGLIRSHLHI